MPNFAGTGVPTYFEPLRTVPGVAKVELGLSPYLIPKISNPRHKDLGRQRQQVIAQWNMETGYGRGLDKTISWSHMPNRAIVS